VRSPAALTLVGDSASGSIGASSLTIQKLWTSGGAANVRAMPQASECPSSSHACDVSKLPAGSEYRVDVSGPAASAIHVVSAGAGTAAPSVLLTGPGYRGALIDVQAARVAVIGADAAADSPVGSLSYRVPAGDDTVHVVLDAPVNTEGQSDVTASRDGNDCLVEVKAHSGAGTGMSGRPLVVRANRDCALVDDGDEKPIDAGNGSAITGGAVGGSLSFAPMSSGTGGSSNGTTPLDGRSGAAALPNAAATDASCNFTASPRIPYGQGGAAVLSVLGLLGLVRRRRAS